ncbi:hypothetical protein DVH24_014549 [Malus domestica]|uniref:Uncharacterized protein n=1 Tax=Malus domestica TaxID=3750 RepID=A0A498KSG8_MALDO|nr:hypothetical protein DVH24_014549 [Malus domestica]
MYNQRTAAVDVGEGDVTLEIGAGTCSLTNVLINAGSFVLAIRKCRAIYLQGCRQVFCRAS